MNDGAVVNPRSHFGWEAIVPSKWQKEGGAVRGQDDTFEEQQAKVNPGTGTPETQSSKDVQNSSAAFLSYRQNATNRCHLGLGPLKTDISKGMSFSQPFLPTSTELVLLSRRDKSRQGHSRAGAVWPLLVQAR